MTTETVQSGTAKKSGQRQTSIIRDHCSTIQQAFACYRIYPGALNPSKKVVPKHSLIIIIVEKGTEEYTIHLRRLWTRAFFRPTSRTVAFSLLLKNSGLVTIFLWLCGLQNTDHVMPFWTVHEAGRKNVLVHRHLRRILYVLRQRGF